MDFPPPLENLVEQFARLPGRRPEDPPSGWPSSSSPCRRRTLRRLRTPSLPPSAPSPTAPYAAILPPGGCAPSAIPKRDPSTICVVADPRDVAAMERGRELQQGQYHVLHGVISPMNHMGPRRHAIKPCWSGWPRAVSRRSSWPPTPTRRGGSRHVGSHIARLLKPFDVRATRLAYGIPRLGPFVGAIIGSNQTKGQEAIFMVNHACWGWAPPVRHPRAL